MSGSPVCTLCGASQTRSYGRQALARWWKCRTCGLYFVHPQPDDATLSKLYRRRYYVDAPPRTGEAEAKARRYWGNRADKLAEAMGPIGRRREGPARRPRVLDVGCGEGDFLHAALQRDWTVVGMEVDPRALSRLPLQTMRHTAVGRLDSAPFRAESFDALTLFDVIEHVRDPVGFLKMGAGLLAPGGTVLLTTPNAAVRKARLLGRWWKYFRFERYLHLYHFTPETMERVLVSAGYVGTRWFNRGMPMIVAARVGSGRTAAPAQSRPVL